MYENSFESDSGVICSDDKTVGFGYRTSHVSCEASDEAFIYHTAKTYLGFYGIAET
jgi:hypothetical protein